MSDWVGETTCIHYGGVKRSKLKKCCGGREFMRHRIACAVHHAVYAHQKCRRKECEQYSVKKSDNDGV